MCFQLFEKIVGKITKESGEKYVYGIPVQRGGMKIIRLNALLSAVVTGLSYLGSLK